MDTLLPCFKIKSPSISPSIHEINKSQQASMSVRVLPSSGCGSLVKRKKSHLTSLPLPQTYKLATNCLRLQGQNGQLGRLNCAKSGIMPELEDEIKLEEELVGVGNLKEKCRESNGIIELLECLEKEAIMGDDEGKEAIDYNRRAHIFDKSSRVFQTMKQRRGPQE